MLWVRISYYTQIFMSSLRQRMGILFSLGESKLISAQSGGAMLGL